MRKEFLLPIFAALIAGCSTLGVDQQAICSTANDYAGPTPTLAIAANLLPTDQLNTTKRVNAALANKLETAFRDTIPLLNGATAASVSIWSPKHGYWSSQTGITPGNSERFWTASVGKLVVSSIILQMVEENRLDLNAQVSNWLPTYPHAGRITVKQLLNHTGGVFSFNADATQQNRSDYQRPEELLKTAAERDLQFCPGTNWAYSNTGYVMLGLIAEAVDGQSLGEIVEQRIAKPLGLETLRLIKPTDSANSFVQTANSDGATVAAIATIFGAGAFASESEDLLKFLHAYLTGRIVSNSSLERAFGEMYPMFGGPMHYGLGVMSVEVPEPGNETVWLGHSGGSPDGKALVYYDTRREVYFAVMINKHAPAEALANRLLKLLD